MQLVCRPILKNLSSFIVSLLCGLGTPGQIVQEEGLPMPHEERIKVLILAQGNLAFSLT